MSVDQHSIEKSTMKKVSHSGKDAEQLVKKFGNQVIQLRAVHNIFKELYENEEAHILMERTAHSFFSHLNTVLQHYILIGFAKITDPAATTMGQENFTIDNLIESVDWPPETQEELTSLSQKTKVFKKNIKKPRNKLFAHNDKKVHLSDKVLDGFPKGEDETFLQTLEEICNIMYKACFNTIFGQISVSTEGDVFDLKKTLKRALAFEKIFSESTGKEKAKLFSYVREDITKNNNRLDSNRL